MGKNLLMLQDSDRFEEDSICSWISEPESVVNNWRGWRRPAPNAAAVVAAAAAAAASNQPAGGSHFLSRSRQKLNLRLFFWPIRNHKSGGQKDYLMKDHSTRLKRTKDSIRCFLHLLLGPAVNSNQTRQKCVSG